MKFILVSLLTLSFSLSAAECFKFDSKDVAVKWTAFKTPSKVGVSGWFKSLGLKDSYKGQNLQETLSGLKFSIDPKSTHTKNEPRDAKIVKYFFGEMDGSKIKGKLKKVSDTEIIMELNMNDEKLEVPLAVELKNSKLIASGVIDLFDFDMDDSLEEINEACKALHLGKTWNDVLVELSIKYSKSCK